VRIEVLGPLRVHNDDGRAVRVGGPRVRALLIALALQPGRVVPVASLLRWLWDEDPPDGGRAALQALVSRLRAAFRDAGLPDGLVESDASGYRLGVAADAVDATAFEALATQGARALGDGDPVAAAGLLRQGLGLWQGSALSDMAGSEYAAGTAARLEELRHAAILDRIEADLASASPSDAATLVAELQALTAADPLAERPRALEMRALYRAGRQAQALAVYERARDLLADRLGVDPTPQLADVHLGVLRQTLRDGQHGEGTELPRPGRAHDGPAWLPHVPLTSFVGRERDVERVHALLAEGRLVTLTGPGGSGKTRLATVVGASAPGAVSVIELGPLSEDEEVPSAVFAALGVRDGGMLGAGHGAGPAQGIAGRRGEPGLDAALPRAPDPLGRLVAVLGARQALLVLDNCEHLIDAAAQLADRVLAGCPGVRILATSREALGITGETVWPVLPLPVPATGADGIAEITASASVRLLRDRAAAVRPGFEVTAANAADVARVCRVLDGMPLAIELAAARLSSLSAAQLADRLSDRFGLLTGGSRTAAARHKTLRGVVDWSWELLEPAEASLARRLAVFPGGATLSAAEQACADGAALGPGGPPGGELPVSAIVDAIKRLVDKSFLMVEEPGDAGAEPRYRMLETVRAYCLERLNEADEATGARRRMCEYLLGLAERAEPMLRTAEQRRWFNVLAAENENIHAAMRWAIDRGDAGTAYAYSRALGWYWLLNGQRADSAALARGVLDMAGDGHAAGLAERSSFEARAEARAICAIVAGTSDWAWAEDPGTSDMSQALAEAQQEAGERAPHLIITLGAALLATLTHQNEQALDLMAAQFTAVDPWVRAGARLMHSFYLANAGRMAQALDDCELALAGFREIGEVWGTAMTLMQRADMARLHGDYAAAIGSLEEAVALGGGLSGWEDVSQLYGNLASMRTRTGDYARASADLDRAEESVRAHGEIDVYLRLLRAELAWKRGSPAEARRLCEELVAELVRRQTVTWHPLRALAQARLGTLAADSGDTQQAAELLEAAFATAVQTAERPIIASVAEGLAGLAVRTGNAQRAAMLLGAADSIRGAVDHGSLDAPVVRSAALELLGSAALQASYRDGLTLSYDEALALATATGPLSRVRVS
jgi:predicted ATPase/DNA-binding SARP family transcriptional activator